MKQRCQFGSYLRRQRAQRGYSLRELAQRSGVTWTVIHRVERGQDVMLETVHKIAQGFGVEVVEFLQGYYGGRQ